MPYTRKEKCIEVGNNQPIGITSVIFHVLVSVVKDRTILSIFCTDNFVSTDFLMAILMRYWTKFVDDLVLCLSNYKVFTIVSHNGDTITLQLWSII